MFTVLDTLPGKECRTKGKAEERCTVIISPALQGIATYVVTSRQPDRERETERYHFIYRTEDIVQFSVPSFSKWLRQF
jgi:hypothetical protein